MFNVQIYKHSVLVTDVDILYLFYMFFVCAYPFYIFLFINCINVTQNPIWIDEC